jgi:hypothetical protein
MRMKRGPEVYLAFTLMEAVAAKSSRPGVLCDSKGVALTANDLYIITECPAEVFEYAFPLLVQVGWVEVVKETPEKIREIPRSPEKIRLQDKTEQDSTEQIPLPKQTAKAKTETTKAGNPNIGLIFCETYRTHRNGTEYRIDGPDRGAIKRLNEVFRNGEEKLCKNVIREFLYDPDPWLERHGWKLSHLPDRVPRYMQKLQLTKASTPAPEIKPNADQDSTDDPYDTFAGELDQANRANASA